LPNSPRFASGTFKNGSDPYSIYQTLTRGYGMMAAQTWMVPRQKYDVIHYLRETYLQPHNPSQYAKADAAYLDKLPKGTSFGPPPTTAEPWAIMDYGPSLMNTYEVGGSGRNIAYKGIAIRLDSGPGGVSRGRHWALFDHDTMRLAALWSGSGFIDWNGIHMNGRHQVHPKLAGEVHIANPTGPGVSDPESGGWDDPRLKGRDGRCYGPLPQKWARYKGTYHYGDQTVLSYTIGGAGVLESFGVEENPNQPDTTIYTRTIEIESARKDILMRIAPESVAVAILGDSRVSLIVDAESTMLKIPATTSPIRAKLLMARTNADALKAYAATSPAPRALKPLTAGGPKRWHESLRTSATIGTNDGPFAVDTFELPEKNPWNAQLRLTGFDFYPDGKQAAICSWDGDVWLVSGLDKPGGGLTWQRIACGLFQPLGLKLHEGSIFVCCRDQIVRLRDLNGDGETDFYECFNNDHQVTEHFHEFAMGLQTDAQGNFYYAKSGCHALPAVVPHHGTLLKVSKDGATTEILATGFRAANGVCLNPDGTFFVTDQEGFWTPKNRINLVERGGFYGNMWGYTDKTDTSDSAMKQPLCWITNEFDRSPAELLWATSDQWGPLKGSLLNLSYGHGKIYVVPHETVNGQAQGGMCALPLPIFPTGIMRARFHPNDGHLYTCGMFAWAGNQTQPGGFYRVRYTGKPADLPLGLKAKNSGIEVTFSDSIDPASAADVANYGIKVWGLERSQNYGSKHVNERTLPLTSATLRPDGKTVRLEIKGLAPTWGMEITYRLKGTDGRAIAGVIHNTIHALNGIVANPTSHTVRNLAGWSIRVDDRLLQPPGDALGVRALRVLEAKLNDIRMVVPEAALAKLRSVTIVLDLTHGGLESMQYHPDASWLKANGYSVELAKCAHIPRAAELVTRLPVDQQPWVILHELAHAYHDQVLGFDEPRIKDAYEKYKKSGRGKKVLHINGDRLKHYALTNQMEFFAEMTEAFFGSNDFFPFNRAELRHSEPEIFEVLNHIWDPSDRKNK
jgi:hypothetical protein